MPEVAPRRGVVRIEIGQSYALQDLSASNDDIEALITAMRGYLRRLIAERERIGPVNLVAADELARIEGEHGSSAQEQADFAQWFADLGGDL